MSTPASLQAFFARGWADVADKIDRFLSETGLVGIALIDIDHFDELVRQVDDEAATDLLVAELTKHLGTELEPEDFTAQVGNDEFLIVRHPLTGSAEMEGMALRMVDSFQRPLMVNGSEYRWSASIGVVTSRTGDNAKDLLRYVGYALDDAKTLGRSRMAAFADEDRELLKEVE